MVSGGRARVTGPRFRNRGAWALGEARGALASGSRAPPGRHPGALTALPRNLDASTGRAVSSRLGAGSVIEWVPTVALAVSLPTGRQGTFVFLTALRTCVLGREVVELMRMPRGRTLVTTPRVTRLGSPLSQTREPVQSPRLRSSCGGGA